MAQSSTKPFNFQISAYGYGMMALSAVVLMLVYKGFFFYNQGVDPFVVWFTIFLAVASGALAVMNIKMAFPNVEKPVAITYIMLMFALLFGGCLTSFFGYSQAYVIYFIKPLSGKIMSFGEFMGLLGQLWAGIIVAAIGSTVAYVAINYLLPEKLPTSSREEPMAGETDGLAE